MGISVLKRSVLAVSTVLLLGACGYSQSEMDAKQHDLDRSIAELKTAKQQIEDDKKKKADADAKATALADQLKKLGVDLENSKTAEQKLKDAVNEYKARALPRSQGPARQAQLGRPQGRRA